MAKSRTLVIALLSLVVLAAIAFTVFRKQSVSAAVHASKPEPVLELLTTDVQELKPGILRQVLPLSGTLRAVKQAAVKAKVAGEVRQVLVREGEAVKEGQLLVRMDTAEYQARLRQAQGALDAARGQLDIAQKTRDNNRVLLEKNFISKNAYDNANSQQAIAQANLDSAQGALDVSRKALADTTLTAPIAGIVSSRSVEPGEKVSPDNRLLEIVDLRKMELEAAVPSADVVHIALGQAVEVKIEGLPQSLMGKVARINPAVQAGSRSVLVYIGLDNPQGMLRVGMYGEAQLTLTQKSGVLTVPASALREESGQTLVYAVENGALVLKPITVGMRGRNDEGDAVEVVRGLEPGAQVVRANLGLLRSGSRVSVKPPSQAAPAQGDHPT